jgi:hypothetical protein
MTLSLAKRTTLTRAYRSATRPSATGQPRPHYLGLIKLSVAQN